MKTKKCLLFILIVIQSAFLLCQDNWEILLTEDFESNSPENWKLDPVWAIGEENSNHYLYGKDHTWATYTKGDLWTDYSFKLDFYIKKNAVHVNFRVNLNPDNFQRYFLGISKNGFYLKKQIGESFADLEEKAINIQENTWHNLEVYLKGKAIQVYLDNTLQIQVYDEEALTSGTVAFETLDESEFFFDNIAVAGEIAYKAPEGYKWFRTGGPIGGLGYDIRIHPKNKSIMYVTDNPSGINKSTDGGKSWLQKNNGITTRSGASADGVPIFSLTIDPKNPDIIWSGTQEAKGIFKSVDGGNSWVKKDNGVVEGNELSIRGFAVHPNNSDIVFAAGEIATSEKGIEFNKTKGVIYKTVDGGNNWYSVWRGDNLARIVIFNYNKPDTLYCSTGIFDREAFNSDIKNRILGGVGVLRSYDAGETWKEINNGMDNLYVGFLEIHPENPDILFAACSNNATCYPPNNSCGGIYKTINGGDSWVKVVSGYENFGAVTISRSDPNIVYAIGARVYRSTDTGNSWEQQDSEQPWGPPGINPGFVISAVVDPENPDIVWVNNYGGGNFVSTDKGITWKNSSKGYTGAALRDITISRSNPNLCYVAGRSGPYITRNGGDDWIGLNEQRCLNESYTIEVFPDNDRELLCASDGNGVLLKSSNGGATWENVFKHPSVNESDPDLRYTFRDIAISPQNNNIVYTGMGKVFNVGNVDPAPEKGLGMFKSVDRGKTWKEINKGLESSNKTINTIAIHPGNSDIVYIGTLIGGIYKTSNGGESWEAMNNGLPFSDVRSLAIDPKHPDILYAGSGNGNGLAVSRDGGKTWNPKINKGIKLICPGYLSPIGKAVQGMDLSMKSSNFLSAVYSIPWTKMLDIVIDPKNTQNIYVADHSAGVIFSPDGGETWSLITEGMDMKSITCLAIHNDGDVLYCGSQGGGVYRLAVKNKAPNLYFKIPISDTIRIYHGEDIDFELFSSDLNQDTLSYRWYLNEELLENRDKTYFKFISENYELKDYQLKAVVSDDSLSTMANWYIRMSEFPTSLANDEVKKLYCVYPNPFRNDITINYFLEEDAEVMLSIYDLQAKKIGMVSIENSKVGNNQFHWNIEPLNKRMQNSGVFILNLLIQNEHYYQNRYFKILKIDN